MIDTSSIPKELRSSREFSHHFLKMSDQLALPGFIEALCAHEAAHVYFYELIAPIIWEPIKTKLWYDSKARRYEGYFAAVNILEYPLFLGGDLNALAEWIDRMVQAKVAGSVVARHLLPSCDGGEQGDRREFDKFCDDVQHQYAGLQIDREQSWNRARSIVEHRIRTDPHILEEIKTKSIEMRKQLDL